MANEILAAWYTSHTLNHKKRQITKQEGFSQRKLEVFIQVFILHGLDSSRELWIRDHHFPCRKILLMQGCLPEHCYPPYLWFLVNRCLHVQIVREEFLIAQEQIFITDANMISHALYGRIGTTIKQPYAKNNFIVVLPPFSLIRDFRKRNTRGNVPKISASLTCYRQIEIHQSQPLVWPSDLLYVMIAGCDWWIAIRHDDDT